ncbi:ATP-binding protein [Pseudomonas mandelii]|uniref:AAA family ATPase n=1 Tax=Pseudomonas mandelii TaxID=75612 RepID=UPI001C834FBE|nr:AAA family ATPase [Pseudomonas mandelii]QZA96246.1 ATP-binding protein [Pseudomonas mandelii]
MKLMFNKVERSGFIPTEGKCQAYLVENNWDDFGYKTLFALMVFDEGGDLIHVGDVKIGHADQTGGWTSANMPSTFDSCPDNYFSLGQDAEYYQNLYGLFSLELRKQILLGLGDVVKSKERYRIALKEEVFKSSLTRTVSLSVIEDQYSRLLSGGALLTNFDFTYTTAGYAPGTGLRLDFQVRPGSKPSTNIHVLIGRNGVGKTTLLNNMVLSIVGSPIDRLSSGAFYDLAEPSFIVPISNLYFSSVTSVSFSAFDIFVPPRNRAPGAAGVEVAYNYIGLKKLVNTPRGEEYQTKQKSDLASDFVDSLSVIASLEGKSELWFSAIKKLESDVNFAEMELARLFQAPTFEEFKEKAYSHFERMSSGHSVVLLTITKLVETVEERTLVLLDEPESHLHPPLLSAFVRALSELLVSRNGVAIIATHSPVVLQEVPRSCVWKLRRTRLVANCDRPENETFGENVGVLTREIFGLEVNKSGFHELLEHAVDEGMSFDQILSEYNDQLGFEAESVLRALLASRKSQKGF